MGNAVDEDGEHAGIGEQDLFHAVGSGVAVKVRGKVLQQHLLNGRKARDKVARNVVGARVILLAFAHRQRDLRRQLFVDVLHQKRAVLLRRQL